MADSNDSSRRFVALLVALGLASMSLAAEDTWTYKANMPTARVFVGGCVLDGKIYVIGGAPSASSVTPAVERYDPILDTWTTMPNMPSARCYHATCTFDGRIYVFGGTSPSMWASATKNVYVYDPQIDIWTQKADMPYANAGFGVAVVDDTIYLIGGNSIELGQLVMAYNPVEESWTQKADMPTARYGLSACAVDGKIYAIGGSTESWSTFKNVEVYDPSTDAWTRKSDMPTQRWGLGTCVVDGKIFAVGGNSAFSTSRAATEVYDPVTDAWTSKSPLQQKRYGLFAGSVGNKIYAIGGSVPGMLSTVEEYDTGLAVASPDFNGDGMVDGKDVLIMAAHWNQDAPTCDIAPVPFGDGIIDVLDLVALAESIGKEVNDPTLIAHWALDETEGALALDSAGDHDGVATGGAAWQGDGGTVGGALEFDGVDDSVAADLILDPDSGPFSLLAWIKGGAAGQVIVSQADARVGRKDYPGCSWLAIDPVLGTLTTDMVSSEVIPPAADVLITSDQWHRVGLVWDDSAKTSALYVDGIEAARHVQPILPETYGGLQIGVGRSGEPGSFFSGLIDDVRIYNRAVKP